MNLNQADINSIVTIISLSGNCEKLREWGFCENLNITKLQCGKNIICNLCGAKVAISCDLAQNVIVEKNHLELK